MVWSEHDANGWHIHGFSTPVSTFQPEWGPHGELFAVAAANGFIEIARLDGGVHEITRSSGASFDPAPAPDGSIYFMSLEPEGFVLRHLKSVIPSAVEREESPATGRGSLAVFAARDAGPSRPYGIGRQEFGGEVAGSWTAYGASKEIGVRMGDVVGRLDALAMLSSGSDSADRGAALAAAWRGWPVGVSAHLFRAGPTRGIELRGDYTFHAPLYVWRLQGGGLAGRSSRAFVDGAFTLRQRKSSERVRAAIDSSNHARVNAGAAATLFGVRIAGSAEAGRRMSLGGLASSVTPDAIQLERVSDPALPLGFADIRRYRGWRGEIGLGGVTAFWQRHDGGDHLDVRGLEVAMSSPPVPLVGLPALRISAGVARASRVRGTKGWLAVRLQP